MGTCEAVFLLHHHMYDSSGTRFLGLMGKNGVKKKKEKEKT